MPEEFAGVMNMLDPLQMRIFHQRDLVETGHHLAHGLEGRVQLGQRGHIGAGAHIFVMGQNGQPVAIDHRHDRARKAIVGPGPRQRDAGFPPPGHRPSRG